MTGRPAESKLPTASNLRATLNTALPLGIGYLGAMLIGITDSIMLGHLSTDALSAAGLAFSIYNVILIIGWGMLFPVMVFLSRICETECLRSRIASRVIRQSLWVGGILAVLACIILWNTTPILMLTGQNPALARMAGRYMDYYLWAIFPIFGRYAFVMALTAMDRTATVALITWLEVGLNIVLNYGLIFGNFGFPAMGIAGAGLASIIVYGVGHTALFFITFGFNGFFRSLVIGWVWKPHGNILGKFFRLGWPKSLELLVISAIFSIFTLLAGQIGTQAVAVNTIALQTVIIVNYTLPWAIADTVTVHVGVARTRKDHAGMCRALLSGISILLIALLPLMIVFWIFPEWIVILFVGSTAPEAQGLLSPASSLILLVGIFVLADGFRIVNNQALNGLADMKAPALIAALAY